LLDGVHVLLVNKFRARVSGDVMAGADIGYALGVEHRPLARLEPLAMQNPCDLIVGGLRTQHSLQCHHLRVGDAAVHAERPLGDLECGHLTSDPVHLRLEHLALGHADHHVFDQTTHDALLGLRRRAGGMPQAGQVLGEVLELRMLLGARRLLQRLEPRSCLALDA